MMALEQVLIFVFCFFNFASCSKKPNVLYFLADDWGFNDVGYHENTWTKTPFIDATAVDDSLIIEKYYAYPLCTITRCALLTGRYAIRYGMQTEVLEYQSDYALSKQETLLAEEFKAQGYSTHAVGKWHLGMMMYDYTPTFRGFDTFFGYYGGALYYYEHTGDDSHYNAYDMRWGTDEYDEPKRYSLYMWAEHTEALIKSLASDEEESDPFFMYIAWQGSHTPSEADGEYLAQYTRNLNDSEIESSSDRLIFQAQTTMTDRLFKVIVDALKETNQWDNTILVFASDNGAANGMGDNSPLRGAKTTLWEGGVRLPAFITGGYLPQHLHGKLFDSYPMHVTDWYKTLLTAAGLEVVVSSKTLDGENLWKLLQTATKVTKDWYRYALTDDSNWDYDHGSVDFANNNNNDNNDNNDLTENEMFASLLSMNKQHRGINDDYIANGGLDAKRDLYDKNLYDGSLDELISITDGRKMLINANSDSCDTDICGALIYAGRWKILYGASQVNSFCDWERTFELTTNDILGCGGIPANVNTSCTCVNSVCLFDLLNDPCEYYDVSSDNIELTQMLYSELEYYYNIQVGPLYNEFGQVDDNVVDPCQGNSSTSCWWKPWSNESSWQDLAFEVWLTNEYSNETSEIDSSDEMEEQDFDSDAATIIIEMANNENENENNSEKKRINSKVERIKEMPESSKSVHGEKNKNKMVGNGNAKNNNNNNNNKEESVNYYDYYIKDSNRNPHFKVFAIGLIVIMAIVFFCIFPFCGDIIRHCETYVNFDWKQFKHETIPNNESDNNSNYMIPSEVSPLVIKVNAQDTQSYTMRSHE